MTDKAYQAHRDPDLDSAGAAAGLWARIEKATRYEDIVAMLDALSRADIDGQAKQRLMRKLQHLGENGPRRDPGCLIRVKILDLLRGSFDRGDIPFLEALLTRHEHQKKSETAAGLRARALLALDPVEPELAAQYAVLLLMDRQVQSPQNEASMTAIALLASGGQRLPLVQYVLAPGSHAMLVSECLRHLTELPVAIVDQLLVQMPRAQDDIVTLGMIDLVTGHAECRHFGAHLADFLRTTDRYEAHYYAAATLASSPDAELVMLLKQAAAVEGDRRKLRNYADALRLRVYDDEAIELARRIESR